MIVCANLFHGLTGTAPPRFTVCRPSNLYKPCASAAWAACGISNDFDGIANFEGILIHALLGKLRGTGAFDGPALQLPALIGSFHEEERVRRAERNLDHLSFDGDLLVDVVGSAE